MAGYDPQRRRPRATPGAADPAAVDGLLDGAKPKAAPGDRVAAAGAVAASVTAPVTARPPLRAVPSDPSPEAAVRSEAENERPAPAVEQHTPVREAAPEAAARLSRAPIWAALAVLVALVVLMLRRRVGSSRPQ